MFGKISCCLFPNLFFRTAQLITQSHTHNHIHKHSTQEQKHAQTSYHAQMLTFHLHVASLVLAARMDAVDTL